MRLILIVDMLDMEPWCSRSWYVWCWIWFPENQLLMVDPLRYSGSWCSMTQSMRFSFQQFKSQGFLQGHSWLWSCCQARPHHAETQRNQAAHFPRIYTPNISKTICCGTVSTPPVDFHCPSDHLLLPDYVFAEALTEAKEWLLRPHLHLLPGKQTEESPTDKSLSVSCDPSQLQLNPWAWLSNCKRRSFPSWCKSSSITA